METEEQMLEEGLRPGDLLFQLSKGQEVEWLISRLFSGVNGQALNHVGLYIGNNHIIEAVSPRVQEVKVEQFVNRAAIDLKGKPCVTIARLIPEYCSLVDKAIDFAQDCLSHPYDNSYGNCSGWYCSQLIIEAFRFANNGHFLFQETPMSFKDPETGKIFPYWDIFYKSRGERVPEGQPGSHPALLSLSHQLTIVKIVGELPFKNLREFGSSFNAQCEIV
ncbi:YiiX/YebB-like N1pC/P60 family cysteine hydrolase [Endozoicomonas sp. Mp262]|uniref:YiiX/YebB-like N1pC/P60 family cysteine hydrolase n=1 Tax=Endozoicomonas sp. Mp262 TaxID=2919499 RepID=UPI0021D7F33E